MMFWQFKLDGAFSTHFFFFVNETGINWTRNVELEYIRSMEMKWDQIGCTHVNTEFEQSIHSLKMSFSSLLSLNSSKV